MRSGGFSIWTRTRSSKWNVAAKSAATARKLIPPQPQSVRGGSERWDRFLTGTDTYPGLLTGKNCTTVPIRLEPIGAAPRGDPCTFLSVPNGRQTGFWKNKKDALVS